MTTNLSNADLGDLAEENILLGRDRYFALIKKHALTPDDLHALLIGTLIDALQSRATEQFGLARDPVGLIEADFERIRAEYGESESDADLLANAVVYGALLLFATTTPSPKRNLAP